MAKRLHPALKLYASPLCPYCHRVTWAMAETGAKHEYIEIDLKSKPAW